MCWSRNICDHLPLYRPVGNLCAEGPWSWNARRWRTGVGGTSAFARAVGGSAAASRGERGQVARPTTRRSRCWRRENGKTKTGRLWTYVRDDRPAGDANHQRQCGSPTRRNRKGRASRSRTSGNFYGHAGRPMVTRRDSMRLYETGRISGSGVLGARAQKVLRTCNVAHKSPVAAEAIETHRRAVRRRKKEIRGYPADQRREVRAAAGRDPLLDSLKQWPRRDVRKNYRENPTRRRWAGALRASPPLGKRCCVT